MPGRLTEAFPGLWRRARVVARVLRRKRQSEQEQQQEQPEQEEQQQQNTTVPVTKKKVSLEDRKLCEADDVEPKIRVNTTIQVAQLREEMDLRNFEAYIIPINGEQDGYTMEAEDRLPFLTGFTGSSGVAVVTTTQQAFWTDGRYFLQAEDELDCQWLLMKSGQEGVPKVMEWLKEVVPAGGKVAADPKLVSAETWKTYNKELAASEISLVAEETNLVDLVWPAEVRPAYPEDPIFIHELDFAGKRWEDKVKEVREEMVKKGADLLIVTSPDEVAWLLNVRGNDVKTTPVFRGYVIVDRKGVELFIPQGKITPAVDLHLNVNQCNDQECVSITAYSAILNRLRALELNPEVKKVMLPKKWSYSDGASYAIYSAVPEDKRLVAVSPVLLMKARKNPTEVQGMKASHVRDAVAVISFLAFMETQTLPDVNKIVKSYTKLNVKMGSSTEEVNLNSMSWVPDMMLVPNIIFSASEHHIFYNFLHDVTMPLYEVGLDYRHGTGHGIGHFLSVHEGEDTAAARHLTACTRASVTL
ncbi:Xaa-Pro aminopeptidase 2 [Portunus trituberculatus]|uniref:Xaa-Pro aminopeptidase 2 n=1 Tax=Portunus trituberculatus TaxID=210409 RepID=A0A5B7E1G3_PORTR|nr:Xaa-Pro aminopeptidase 2 [Portunus trituberculatus]